LRNQIDGTVGNTGYSGYYWSITVNGTYVQFLYFDSGTVLPTLTSNRAYGFSIRCVAE
jgi:hypothetical protein